MKINGSSVPLINKDRFFDIRCHLHTLCNLRCEFCSETKEKGFRENNCINLDYIKLLPIEMYNSISHQIKRDGMNIISLCLQGGEVFSDNLPDTMFDAYREFICEFANILGRNHSNVQLDVLVVSNGVYKNHKRVEAFLREFNARLTLSYDPIGRFANDYQRELWYNTFEYFRDKEESGLRVSTVLTKKNIYAYINGDEIFEKIPDDIFIVNHEYVPRLDYGDYLASDDDLFNFYKWAIDNGKFNISSIDNILSSHKNNKPLSTCSETIDYIFDENYKMKYNQGYINQCAENPLSKEDYYGEYSGIIEDPTDCTRCKESIGLQKRGCNYCEYFSKCPKVCWTQILFTKYDMGICPIQRAYDYIQSNPSILDKYNKWSDRVWKR